MCIDFPAEFFSVESVFDGVVHSNVIAAKKSILFIVTAAISYV